MARWTAKRPNEEYLEDILSAADAWRERCLLQDGSVFLDDEELWTRENIRELTKACRPDSRKHGGGRDGSWSLLRQQMEGKRPVIVAPCSGGGLADRLVPDDKAFRGIVLETQPLRGTLGVIKSTGTGK